jgi:anaerobic ribonucleoside-triphosphate reductase activating protein
MRLSGITPESFVDGPGLRCVIFTQGCHFQCLNCHNPETWDVSAGKEYSVKQIIRLIKKHTKKIRGITFSGGEPFLQAAGLAEIAAAVHGMELDVVTYTGYTYEQLIEEANADALALIYASDILIDGKYIHELRSPALRFKGSSNQRVIDVAKTKEKGQIVLWDCD